jgi:hypothetical protein
MQSGMVLIKPKRVYTIFINYIFDMKNSGTTTIKSLGTDEEMKERINKRFGTKIRTFSIGNKVYACHRISQSWRPGIITKCIGVIY